MDDTRELQEKFDRGGYVDLQNRTWVVTKLTIRSTNAWFTAANGWIHTLSDKNLASKRYGAVEVYADGNLNVDFENVGFSGPLTDYTDDFRVNQARAKTQGAFCAGVNVMAGRPKSLNFRNCPFRNLFAGIGAFHSLRTSARGCDFDSIAGHCLVASIPAGNDQAMTVDMYQCSGSNSGALFDLSAPDGQSGSMPVSIPVGRIRQCEAYDMLGRTKVHANWKVDIDRLTMIQRRPIANQFAGLNIPQAHSVLLQNSHIEGFPAGAIWCRDFSSTFRPTLRIENTKLIGGQMAVNSEAVTELRDVQISNVLYPWGATRPGVTDRVAILNPATVESTAVMFVGMRGMLRDMNSLHGTAYSPSTYWWLDRPVRERVEELERLASPV